MKRKKPQHPRPRKENAAECVAIAAALVTDYISGGDQVYQPLDVQHQGQWLELGRPHSWLSSADWQTMDKNSLADCLACEIIDRLEFYSFKITNKPEKYKA